MSLDERFTDAQARVKTLTSRPSNEDLLELYALFKQASDGDVSGKKPGMFDLEGARQVRGLVREEGLSADQAKEKYVALVDRLVG